MTTTTTFNCAARWADRLARRLEHAGHRCDLSEIGEREDDTVWGETTASAAELRRAMQACVSSLGDDRLSALNIKPSQRSDAYASPYVLAGNVRPGTPVYHWADREAFARHMLELGGSRDTSGGRIIATDADWHVGRYPRQAHPDRHEPGTTMSFYCSWYRQPSTHGVVVLAGAPWTSRADRDAAYAVLAAAGCTPNDANDEEEAIAATVLKTPDPAPGWEDRAFERAKREGVI